MLEYPNESKDRIEKIQKLKDAWVIPYANHYSGKQNIINLVENAPSKDFGVDDFKEAWAPRAYKIAWRLTAYRSMGKIAFARLLDHTSSIQLCFMRDKFKFNTGRDEVENLVIGDIDRNSYKIVEKLVDVWDYIWVEWDMFWTHKWELTLFVDSVQILSKAIRPLPEKFHWLKDEETIYRQRYLDLIANDDSFARFKLKSKFIKTLRDFYYEYDFIEIDTPILGNARSWARAKPFITHHNDFDEEFYLRISPETALKKATVGRFERVVEFSRNFRNEWSDPSHVQEFNSIEHYRAYWNFEDNMRFTEDMFNYIFDKIPELKSEIMVKDKSWNDTLVNFKTPWQKIDYIEWVKESCGIDVSKYRPWDEMRLKQDIKDAWVTFEGMDQMLVPTLIDYLYKKALRPSIVGPTFVYNYPKTMQPLARQSDSDPHIVEQFQLVINGWEVIKAYSELVDPQIQKSNFDAQALAIEHWDEEATQWDDDFVLAMEYGMPPQSGWGMGIERIFSLLTHQDNLRDVVLFPLMKSHKDDESGDVEEQKIDLN